MTNPLSKDIQCAEVCAGQTVRIHLPKKIMKRLDYDTSRDNTALHAVVIGVDSIGLLVHGFDYLDDYYGYLSHTSGTPKYALPEGVDALTYYGSIKFIPWKNVLSVDLTSLTAEENRTK